MHFFIDRKQIFQHEKRARIEETYIKYGWFIATYSILAILALSFTAFFEGIKHYHGRF